jgi:hypothetical protein
MSEEDKDVITPAFVRQRRNLMAISLILIFWKLADVSVEEMHVLNVCLVIGQTNAVLYALWVAWGYWVWRYWQRLLELNGLAKFSALFQVQVLDVATSIGRAKLERSTGCDVLNRKTITHSQDGIILTFNARKGDARDVVELQTTISGGTLKMTRLRAALLASVNGVPFTEYVVPIIIGFGAPTMWLLSYLHSVA